MGLISRDALRPERVKHPVSVPVYDSACYPLHFSACSF
jgi:hypothetical protein